VIPNPWLTIIHPQRSFYSCFSSFTGSSSPLINASNCSTKGAENIGRHRRQLDVGILQTLRIRFAVRASSFIAVSGQIAQLVRQKLCDPLAVSHIALPPGTCFRCRAFTNSMVKRLSRML